MPLIFLPPSKPRPKQVGAERHDRLSMMTALESAISPQACRQARIKRLSRRRQQAEPRPASEQRAKRDVAELTDGAPLHAAEPDAPDRQDRLAQRRSGQRRLRPGAGRPGAVCRHGPASTASTKASTSLKASHEAREVLAGLKAVPICGWSDGCWRWPQT
jgi:hypothetical protein